MHGPSFRLNFVYGANEDPCRILIRISDQRATDPDPWSHRSGKLNGETSNSASLLRRPTSVLNLIIKRDTTNRTRDTSYKHPLPVPAGPSPTVPHRSLGVHQRHQVLPPYPRYLLAENYGPQSHTSRLQSRIDKPFDNDTAHVRGDPTPSERVSKDRPPGGHILRSSNRAPRSRSRTCIGSSCHHRSDPVFLVDQACPAVWMAWSDRPASPRTATSLVFGTVPPNQR